MLIEYEILIKTETGSKIDNAIMAATNFKQAVSNASDKFGWDNILGIVQAPYTIADEMMGLEELMDNDELTEIAANP